MSGEERDLTVWVIYTWKDLFVKDIRELLPTKLVVYRILIYPNAVPKVARLTRYIPKEEEWQKIYIPELEEAGIITKYMSPWLAKTKFLKKADYVPGVKLSLRMVY